MRDLLFSMLIDHLRLITIYFYLQPCGIIHCQQAFKLYPESIHIQALTFNSQQNPLIKFAPPKSQFPPEGFQIDFSRCIPQWTQRTHAVLSEFFHSIDNSIRYNAEANRSLVVFPSYESITKYLNHLYIYFESTYALFS